jgi:hypothetical protein
VGKLKVWGLRTPGVVHFHFLPRSIAIKLPFSQQLSVAAMLLRDVKRLFPLGVLIVLGFFLVRSYNSTLIPQPEFNGPLSPGSSRASKTESKSPGKTGTHVGHPAAGYDEGAYHDLFSVSTPDKKYFPLVFDRQHAMNPNAIPHPTLEDTWIMVAQLQRSDVNNTVFFAELVCNAAFKNNALSCVDPPLLLPISRTPVSILQSASLRD